jgi:hypothetical protein
MTIRHIGLLVICCAFMVLVGCGGSSSSGSLSISFQPAPPSSVVVSTSSDITAVVANDSKNGGVDWTLTCGGAACGSLSAAHTASGTANSFTAPANIPTGNTVSITAASTTDSSQKVTATITIAATGFTNATLQGNYAFLTQGTDFSTGFLYQLAGVLAADGDGNVTGGELTYSNLNLVDNDVIANGTYTIGGDGRGAITLNTGDNSIGVNGQITLGVVVLSSSRALITQFDESASSSGDMDLQTEIATPIGGFAFVVNGSDLAGDVLSQGGVFNIDSPNTISGTGSVADQNVTGNVASDLSVSGTISNPDALGTVVIDLNIDGTAFEFLGYMVDSLHLKLIENDEVASAGGPAIGQGPSTGTFTANSFNGTFAYGILGFSINGPDAIAGSFNADGTGNLTNGLTDANYGGSVISDSLTGSYSVDGSGTGRTIIATNYGSNGAGPNLIAYLTGNGNPPLLLNADNFALGTGIAYPQSAGPFSFNGPYGLNFSAFNPNGENNGTAQITADNVGGTFSGTGDINIAFVPTPNQAVSGSFTANANGRFPASVTSAGVTADSALYIVNSGLALVIETDDQQVSLGQIGTQAPQITQGRKRK